MASCPRHPQALLHTDPHPRADFLQTFDDSASGLLQIDDLIAAFRPDVMLIHRLADAGCGGASGRPRPGGAQ